MPALGTAPNAFSTNHYMTTAGSDAGVTTPETISFGFVARSLRIVNTCADPLFFDWSGAAATTVSAYLAGSGGELKLENCLAIESISLKTTSTSTGAVPLPTGRPRVSIIAWSA